MEDSYATYQLPADKANFIADVYEASFNVTYAGRVHYIDEHKLQLATENNVSDFKMPFTLHEQEFCVKGSKKTLDGQDDVHNLMIKNLPLKYLQWLLDILNYSCTKNYDQETMGMCID